MESKIKDLGTATLITDPQDTDAVVAERDGHIQRINMKTLATKVSGSVATDISAAQAAAKSANDAATAATSATKTLQDSVSGLLAAQGDYAYYAALRQYGAASPTFSKTYGTKAGLLATLSHFKMGTFKNGELQHVMAPGRVDLATNGDTVAIDGSDGDLLLFVDTTIYRDRFTGSISGTKYNGIGLGLVPHLVGDNAAKEFKPFAITPDYTVNCKLSGDTRSQAHCIYNESIAGAYAAPTALFKQTFKANGNGYPSQSVSSLDSSEQARNKNANVNSNSPYMGGYYEFFEILWEAMYAELGTLDIADPKNFGYGCTATAADASNFADTAISGISGVKIIQSNGTVTYQGIADASMQIGATGAAVPNYDGLCGNTHYVFLTCLETQRILSNITKAGLVNNVGNASAVFTNMGASVVTDGSINLSTGAGMTSGEKYIQVRNVPNCQGLGAGVLTAVVNIYIKLDIADGVYLAGGKTALTGGKAIFKLSVPVYRGYSFFKGMFQQTEGAYYRQNYLSGTDAVNDFYSADSYKDVPVINNSIVWNGSNSSQAELKGMLRGLKYRFTTDRSSGWVINAEYNGSLFGYSSLGAGQHSYECAFVWKDASWGFGGSNGQISKGQSVVNASVLGCAAIPANAGRFVYAYRAASYRFDSFAGAFAVPVISGIG